GRVYQALFSPDSTTVLTLSADKTARLWDARTGTPRDPPLTHPKDVVYGEFSRDGRLILTLAASDRNVYLWDATTGQPAGTPIVHDAEANFATFALDDGTIVVGTGDQGDKKPGAVHWWTV